MYIKLTPQELAHVVKMSEDLKAKLLKLKKCDEETFFDLQILSRRIYSTYVRRKLNTSEFMILAAMLSLQSCEVILRDYATIEADSGTKV